MTYSATQIVLPGIVAPEGLAVEQTALDAPVAGQALVRLEATGVSFAEQQMRRGKYFDQPPFPFTPGYDLVGTVEAVGDGVDADLVGTRVAALVKVGGWASHQLIDVHQLVAVPDALPSDQAEALITNGITAYRMLFRAAKVEPGDTIVVHGATGGVGSLLVRLAVKHGVTVIGVASDRDAVQAAGAMFVDRHTEDLTAAVRELAPNGVDAVFDHVGGAVLDQSWAMLNDHGTLISYGTASTRDVPGDPMAPVMDIIGRLHGFLAEDGERHADFFNLWAGIEEDAGAYWSELRTDLAAVFAEGLDAPIAGTWKLDDVAAALTAAERGGLVGKVILVP